jgi:uncharacterized protein with von Willebrand factor type A (vWA) domain
MIGNRFSQFKEPEKNIFDTLFELLQELLVYTSGDVDEALDWLNQLDKQYQITTPEYGMGDFIRDLKENGYITDDNNNGSISITPKSEQTIRKRSLENIFGKLKKSKQGNHKTFLTGNGDEVTPEIRPFVFGDALDSINVTTSIRNAQINHGLDEFRLTEEDLAVNEREYKTQNSTVLMIDISHSMILYGEDRITPAKRVAMALAELIQTKYPKDTLDIIVFGDDAYPIQVKDLPYLQVGPFHTNTSAGLDLAMDLLRRRKSPNKQIFMITDGKPSCLKEGNRYYKNSIGLDRKIVNKALTQAAQCKRLGIPITTFMIASDPYLQQFIRDFTKVNSGKAFYSSLDGLGEFIFEDYIQNRRKKVN